MEHLSTAFQKWACQQLAPPGAVNYSVSLVLQLQRQIKHQSEQRNLTPTLSMLCDADTTHPANDYAFFALSAALQQLSNCKQGPFCRCLRAHNTAAHINKRRHGDKPQKLQS
jgi:hypothetical protein